MQKLLKNYIINLNSKNILFKKYSKNILRTMNYQNSNLTNFTNNSGKMISKLIDHQNK